MVTKLCEENNVKAGKRKQTKITPAILEASVPGQSFVMSRGKHTQSGHGRKALSKQRLLLNLSQKRLVFPDAQFSSESWNWKSTF